MAGTVKGSVRDKKKLYNRMRTQAGLNEVDIRAEEFSNLSIILADRDFHISRQLDM